MDGTKKAKVLVAVVLLLLLGLYLLGCGGGKTKGIRAVQEDPEALYKEGLTLFNKRNYEEAQKKFDEIKSGFPDSPPYSLWAELKVADCLFHEEHYVEAVAAYDEFRKIHPTHEDLPYVQYQIGMSYYNQMLSLDRDQTFTRKALASFEYLVAQYPQSLFTEKGKEKIEICLARLADHEFYIGEYYYRKGKFSGAARRFHGLLEQFPGTPGEDKALYYLGKSYEQMGEREKAKIAFSRILEEFPESRYGREARTILDQGVPVPEPKGKRASSAARTSPESLQPLDRDRLGLVKFEDEGKRSVSPERVDGTATARRGEGRALLDRERTKATASSTDEKGLRKEATRPGPSEKGREEGLERAAVEVTPIPAKEERITVRPTAAPEFEVEPEQEMRRAVPPPVPVLPERSDTPEKKAALPRETQKDVLPVPREVKLDDPGQPIDITSDRVESLTKDKLIIFRGNVTARQKDIVIYADILEAVIQEDGKGIDRVIAGGNVKVQQGLRVASCQKAVFYNQKRRVVLTGEPRVWEGENMVSGEEIVFDMEQNRVEVKGGSTERGRAKIVP